MSWPIAHFFTSGCTAIKLNHLELEPTLSAAWIALHAMHNVAKTVPSESMQPVQAAGWELDLSRARIPTEGWQALHRLAVAAEAPVMLRALFAGEPLNVSESRAAWHTALRADLTSLPSDIANAVQGWQLQAQKLAADPSYAHITDVIHIGLGGSYHAVELAHDVLAVSYPPRVKIHFWANCDPQTRENLLRTLNPKNTLIFIVSKSWTTAEVASNASYAIPWLKDNLSNLWAVTTKADLAIADGVPANQVLPLWDWVGGRFSLWSAVGASLIFAHGWQAFAELLAGARIMDEHCLEAPPTQNAPLLHALATIWQHSVARKSGGGIYPYSDRLRELPTHLQQLIMESLGKPSRYGVGGPFVFGGVGTTVQHSFFQWLHQGANHSWAEFIISREAARFSNDLQQKQLLANAYAQIEALSVGEPPAFPGQHPVHVLKCDDLTPATLGALLALYEHSVFIQSLCWRLNAFDQPGVELGKRLAQASLRV